MVGAAGLLLCLSCSAFALISWSSLCRGVQEVPTADGASGLAVFAALLALISLSSLWRGVQEVPTGAGASGLDDADVDEDDGFAAAVIAAMSGLPMGL